jgi:hypothetical protein
MINRIITTVLVLLSSVMVSGASYKDTVDHSVQLVEIDWFSNSTFLGRYSTQRYPYLSLSYLGESKKGWWFNPTLNHLFNAGHFIDEVDLSAGKDFVLSKKFDGYFGYTHYFFHNESPSVRSGLSNNVEGNLGYQWWAYSALSVNYNFSSVSSDFFMILSTAKSFYIDDIFKKDIDYIRIKPAISLVAGTQEFYEEYVVSSGHGKGGGKGKGNIQSSTVVVPTTTFSIMNLRLKLPIRYTYKKFNLQAAYSVTFPMNAAGLEPISVFSLSTWIRFK